MKTAQQMADKFTRALADSGKAFTEGIQGVTRSPAEAAIAAAPKYESRIQEAIREGRYQAGLQGVSLEGWKQAAKAGASKLTSSAQQAGQKYLRYAQEAAPVLAQISAEVQAMPNLTESDMEQRMLENMRKMKQLKGMGRRGR